MANTVIVKCFDLKRFFSVILLALAVLSGLLVPAVSIAAESKPDLYTLGTQAYRRGELSQALSFMTRAAQSDPSNPHIHYYMAICLDRLERDQEALLQYQQVVDKASERAADPKIIAYSQTRVATLQTVPKTRVSLPGGGNRGIVPLKESKNALMVDVTLVNNQTGQRATGTFIIDTGATYTSISQEIADSLGLVPNPANSVRITTANGKIDVPKVNLDKLMVNGVEAHHVPATIIQVKPGSSFSGLLGLSFIRQFKITIDPIANHLVLENND